MAQVIYGQRRQIRTPDYSSILKAWYDNDQVNRTLEESRRIREETRLTDYVSDLINRYDLQGAMLADPTAVRRYLGISGFTPEDVDLLMERGLVHKDLTWEGSRQQAFFAAQNSGQGFDKPKVQTDSPFHPNRLATGPKSSDTQPEARSLEADKATMDRKAQGLIPTPRLQTPPPPNQQQLDPGSLNQLTGLDIRNQFQSSLEANNLLNQLFPSQFGQQNQDLLSILLGGLMK